MKYIFMILTAVFLITGCSSENSDTPFYPEKEDMLTDREKFALFDYSRGFLISSKKIGKSKSFSLSQSDIDFINKNDPDIRIHYTAPKTGKMFLSWTIPGRRQIVVSAQGYLVILKENRATWRVRLSNFSRSGYVNPAELGMPE